MLAEGLVDKEWGEKFIRDEVASIVEKEYEWNDYLLLEGSIPGYITQIGQEFITYQAEKALVDCGLKVSNRVKPNDTIIWFNHYRNIDNQVVAQQEQKSNQYQKGVIKNDLGKFDAI
jgi:ribonucleotide reductase beta subunit family protein with ferritin-like domain